MEYKFKVLKRKGRVELDEVEYIAESWFINFDVMRSNTNQMINHLWDEISWVDFSHIINRKDIKQYLLFWNDLKLTQQVSSHFSYWSHENTFGSKFSEKKKKEKLEEINYIFEAMHLSYTMIKFFEIFLKQKLFPMTSFWEASINRWFDEFFLLASTDSVERDILNKKRIDISNTEYNNRQIVKDINERINEITAIQILIKKFKIENPKEFEEILKKEKNANSAYRKLNSIEEKVKIMGRILGIIEKDSTNTKQYHSVIKRFEINGSLLKLRNFISHPQNSLFDLLFDYNSKEQVLEGLKYLINKEKFELVVSEFEVVFNSKYRFEDINGDSKELYKIFISKIKTIIFD